MTTMTPNSHLQRTIQQPASLTGIGLHSGQAVTLSIKPADINTGIAFVRTDLQKRIMMDAFLVQDTLMSSNLIFDNAKVGTVEHVLSAVASTGIDNLIIEVSAPEMPIMDGSAIAFVELIKQAGIATQSAPKKFIKIIKPVSIQDGDKKAHLVPYDKGFLLDFEIDFEHIVIKSTPQRLCFDFSTQNFVKDIAKARTFGFLKDLQTLKDQGLALGGSLENAIVMDDTQIINDEKLRYLDEFVRHKILDAIGDLFIIGHPILGKFCGYKSGHALNNKLIRAVLSDPSCYQIVTFYDKNGCPIDYN